MDIKTIRNEKQYDYYMEELEKLVSENPQKNTKKFDDLEILILLIERYENEKCSIISTSPIEAIKFHMDQHELNQNDFSILLGSKSRASEILNHKRDLSLKQI